MRCGISEQDCKQGKGSGAVAESGDRKYVPTLERRAVTW